MRKYIIKAIIQFIVILLLTVAITLGWVCYVYGGMPLVSVICLTLLDVLLLSFHAIEYVIVIAHYNSEREDEDE